MQPKYIKKLDIKRNGNNVIEARFQSDKGYSRDEIKKITQQIRNRYKNKIDGSMQISMKHDFGWRSGHTTNIKQPKIHLYSIVDQYEQTHKEQENFNEFSIFLLPTELKGGCDGKRNNCLWKCIKDSFNGVENMTHFKKPYLLKSYLKLGNRDKVDVKYIPKLEKKLLININISGDVVRRSLNKHMRECNIKLSNQHYSLLPKKTGLIKQDLTEKPIIMYRMLTREDITTYDGKETKIITYKDLIDKKLWKSVRLMKCRDDEELTNAYHKYIDGVEKLKKKSKGFINMYKTGKYSNTAKYIFHHRYQAKTEPDNIEQYEMEFIENAKMGGLIFANKGKYNNAICYDRNSMYPNIMASKNITFPLSKGETTILEEIPEILSYGIYRVKIERSGSEIDKLFRFNTSYNYTHFDIKSARSLGLKMKIINDGSPNALLYKSGRSTGHILFGDFVNEMMPYKKAGYTHSKLILNSLWGALCEVNKRTTIDNNINITDGYIQKIEPLNDGHIVRYIKYDKLYCNNFARIGPFLTSYARMKMAEDMKDNIQNIVRCHTDGFISLTKMKLPLDDWKIEKEGDCEVIHCNNIKWF